jgi:phosphoribosyl-AMP cyclohydrolase
VKTHQIGKMKKTPNNHQGNMVLKQSKKESERQTQRALIVMVINSHQTGQSLRVVVFSRDSMKKHIRSKSLNNRSRS